MNEFPIRDIGPVSTIRDSTHLGRQTQELTNTMLRPLGGIKGPPKLDRLLNIATFSTLRESLHGVTPAATLKTCAYKINSQGKNFLFFYDWVSEECRGLFYMGDNGYPGSIADESGNVIADETGEPILDEAMGED